MKITINQFICSDGSIEDVILYNTIKRYQEDLLRRVPHLNEFVLVIKLQDTYGYLPGNLRYSYQLDESEIHLKVTCAYRTTATVHLMNTELKNYLSNLLDSL